MPDITFANLEEIHEDLREFAVKTGEAYTVNVVPKKRLDEFRDNNIKALQERDNFKSFRDRAIEVLGSDDLDGHFNMLQEYAQIVQRVKDGQLVENKGLDEAIEERVREMKKGYESQITELSTKARVAEGKAVNVDQKLRRYLVETKVRQAAHEGKSGVIPSAVDDIVSRAFGVFEADEEGTLTPKQGGATLYGPNGGIMTPAEWIASLKEKSPHLFKNSGGGSSVSGDKKFGGFTEAQYDKLTPMQKMELANNPAAFQR